MTLYPPSANKTHSLDAHKSASELRPSVSMRGELVEPPPAGELPPLPRSRSAGARASEHAESPPTGELRPFSVPASPGTSGTMSSVARPLRPGEHHTSASWRALAPPQWRAQWLVPSAPLSSNPSRVSELRIPSVCQAPPLKFLLILSSTGLY